MFKHDVYGMLGDEEIQDEHSMLVSSNIKQLNAELEGATGLRPLPVKSGLKNVRSSAKYKYSNRL